MARATLSPGRGNSYFGRARARQGVRGGTPQEKPFSFSEGRRWTAHGILTSRRGPDEGSLPPPSKTRCLPSTAVGRAFEVKVIRRWRIHYRVGMRPGPPPSESRTGVSAPAIHPKCRTHLNSRENGGVLRTRDALHLGIHPETLYRMRDSGTRACLGRGLFRLSDLPPLGSPDLVTVGMKVPSGVICLISALAFHELTTEIPHEVYLALHRGTEPPRLDYPPLRLFRLGRGISPPSCRTCSAHG